MKFNTFMERIVGSLLAQLGLSIGAEAAKVPSFRIADWIAIDILGKGLVSFDHIAWIVVFLAKTEVKGVFIDNWHPEIRQCYLKKGHCITLWLFCIKRE